MERGSNLLSRKNYEQLCNEMRSLPIRMKDRRELYEELEAINNFKVASRGVKSQKRIPFFRLRLYFQLFKSKVEHLGLGFWSRSLREIEVKRGTLTANVFYYIRWNLFLNLILTLVGLFGILLPHVLLKLLVYSKQGNIDLGSDCDHDGGWNEYDANRTVFSTEDLANCCFHLLENYFMNLTEASNKASFLVNMAKIVGGRSSFLTSPFFYGFYSSHSEDPGLEILHGNLPALYLLTVITVLVISFCFTVKRIGDGISKIVLDQESDVRIFSDLVFSGFWQRAKDENESRYRRKLWLQNLRVAIKNAKTTIRTNRPSRWLILKRWLLFSICALLIALGSFCIHEIAITAYGKIDELNDEIDRRMSTEFDRYYAGVILISIVPSIAIAAVNGILPDIFVRISKSENYGFEASAVLLLCRSMVLRLLTVGLAIYRLVEKTYVCEVAPNTCTICANPDLDRKHNGRERCWESRVGQELYRIIYTELAVKIIVTFLVDPGRRLIKRVFYRFKHIRPLGRLRFLVVRNSIDIINVQVMTWVGFYFAPWYPVAVVIYLFVIFYVKKFSALVNCTTAPEVYRVSRTTTIFHVGELVSFVIVVIFLIYGIGYHEPSKGCGPFPEHKRNWEAFLQYSYKKGTSELNWLGTISYHVFSMHVYIPLQLGAIAWLIHKYQFTTAMRDQYHDIKDMIILENQDKQYLVNRLLRLRSQHYNISYFDPLSIYASEQKFQESTKARLEKQWSDLLNVRKDSEMKARQWYRGFRASRVAAMGMGLPTMEELKMLSDVRRESAHLKKRKSTLRSRKRRRTVASKKSKVSFGRVKDEQKPFSAPPMKHLQRQRPSKPKLKRSLKSESLADKQKQQIDLVASANSISIVTTPPSTRTSAADDGRKSKVSLTDAKVRKRKSTVRKKSIASRKKNRVAPTQDGQNGQNEVVGSSSRRNGEATDEDEYKSTFMWQADGAEFI